MSEMNIYKKMQKAKRILSETNLTKSGQNSFANFKYYELADFMPSLVKILDDIGLYSQVKFAKDNAVLIIHDADKPEDKLHFLFPNCEIEIKDCNKIQTIGGVQTYQRRYLYMNAFDITENDISDATTGKEDKEDNKKPEQKDPVTTKEVTQKAEVTEYKDELNAFIITNKFDKKEVCETFGLNSKSTEEDFKKALIELGGL